ncbi:hypothetical protein VHA01S_080_00140 [Vibrio halioticoli NBRC 102217]|uniref:Uncharacterized protein n=1 Tax=Vibrio halioticoli NBRC 102217 TaxID=1219072 RepID=V5F6C5_9VIBR|nr:conjugative transfer protein MobI(A/C) [Vibrio halioticoli]GAD91274.1 hypothetical protein VHA01S_080_00140 [Vibrio halioticoli NBRC 102217]
MQEIQTAIYNEIDKLYDEAKFYLEFWMTKVAKREVQRVNNKSNREYTNYSLSLEFSGVAFRSRWFRVQFVRNGDKTIRLSKSIAVPRNNIYSKSNFKYADDWEVELIEQVEFGLGPIRNKLKLLMKAHQNILLATKNDKTPLLALPCRERVNVTTRSIAKIKESLM